ncbi:hypothetical protein MWH25_08155 [Natroniella acetigena]|uniref:hypothetical protein n=1 Tax=Natroniella acetigena TaxID=52004 RepID=UPI002009EFE3|nr:hypothetical protein [Natroniella acetigena]MCK8827715.1 hypothetical protein [Natroniella acetigena]
MINGIEGLDGVSEIEIGKIKTGEKNKKGYPSKLDYFKIVRPTKKGVSPSKEKVRKQMMKDFSEATGEKLQSLSSDKCSYSQADKFISWLEDKSKVVKDDNFKLEVVERPRLSVGPTA